MKKAASRLQQFSGLTLLGIGLTLIVLGAVMNASAPAFEACARIRVERDVANPPPANGGGSVPSAVSHPGGYDVYFLQTELKVIQSEPVLHRVVDELNLQAEWGKRYEGGEPLKVDQAIRILRRRLEIRPVRNTSFVEIRVVSGSPDEAARIANHVAESYRNLRYESGLRALKDEWERHKKAMAEANNMTNKSPAPVLTAEMLRELNGQLIPMQADQVRAETMLTSLKALAPSERRSVILTATGLNAELTGLTADLNQVEKSRLAALKDFGDKHPTVQSIEKTIQTLNDKIDRRVEGIMLGLENKCEAGKAAIAKLEERIEKAKEADLAAAKSGTYLPARRLAELPNRPAALGVEIIDHATPINRPVSPNHPRAFAVMALGAFLSVVGLTLFRGRSSPEVVA